MKHFSTLQSQQAFFDKHAKRCDIIIKYSQLKVAVTEATQKVQSSPGRLTQIPEVDMESDLYDNIPKGYERFWHGSPEEDLTRILPKENYPGGKFSGLFALRHPHPGHGYYEYYIDIPVDKIADSRDIIGDNYEKTFAVVEERFPTASKEELDILYDIIQEDRGHELQEAFQADYNAPIPVERIKELFGKSMDAGDVGWETQELRGLMAERAGYHAIEMEDEHGKSYYITCNAITSNSYQVDLKE